MTHHALDRVELARIEAEARRLRAQALRSGLRRIAAALGGLFGHGGAKTAHAA